MDFITNAYAQGGAPGGNPLVQFMPMILIFVVFYLIVIRPQIKKQKAHATMLGNMKIGDNVVTASGIIGSIKDMTEKVITVEIASSVRVKMLRNQISQILKGPIDEQLADS